MAFDPLPQSHIVGLDVVAGGATVTGAGSVKYLLIPLTSLPLLSEAECDEATGDIRKVALALCEKLYQIDEAITTANKSTKWRCYRSPGAPNKDGVADYSYTNRLTVNAGTPEVVTE
jgi:hypothetical protein